MNIRTKKWIVATLSAIALVGRLSSAFAEELECSYTEGQQKSFQVFENIPSNGFATLLEDGHSTNVVQFQEHQSQLNTRLGVELRLTKVYSHPYYEIKISGRVLPDDTREPNTPSLYYGWISTEQNGKSLLECKIQKE